MKKILAMTMALAMMLSLAACGKKDEPSVSGSTSTSNGSSVSTSASNGADFTTVTPGKLTMSTNASFPPYEMVADDGSFEGIDVEVAGAIAEKLGLELVVDDMGFDAALQAAQTGKSDMVMAGVTVTSSPAAYWFFTVLSSSMEQIFSPLMAVTISPSRMPLAFASLPSLTEVTYTPSGRR